MQRATRETGQNCWDKATVGFDDTMTQQAFCLFYNYFTTQDMQFFLSQYALLGTILGLGQSI